jgi:hypothetical protein
MYSRSHDERGEISEGLRNTKSLSGRWQMADDSLTERQTRSDHWPFLHVLLGVCRSCEQITSINAEGSTRDVARQSGITQHENQARHFAITALTAQGHNRRRGL